MGTMQSIVKDRQQEIVAESIRQQRRLVMTHNSEEGWRTFKSTFALGSPSAGELLVRVSCPDGAADAFLPSPGDTLGGTFRVGHKKCMFCTVVRSVQRQSTAALLTLGWPEHIQQLQRRAYERATPPRGTIIAVRFWRETGPSDPTLQARSVRHGQLEDISCGGMRIKVADPKETEIGADYRCVFTPRPGKPSIVLDAILRHREAVDRGRASLGFQFVGLETTPESLRTLDRLARLVSRFRHAGNRRTGPPRPNAEDNERV